MDCPVIEMKGVVVAHPRTPRLPLIQGVDWEVESGDCWVVAGLQGSGKTILLEVAAGLYPCLAGEVRLFGQSLKRGAGEDPWEQSRRRVGLVFDGAGRLFPAETVLENVALPLCYHRNLGLAEVASEVIRFLSSLGLDHLAEQRAGGLSRAWAHRVALARALILRPQLLLVDNPMTGLDPSHARWWRVFLQRLLAGDPEFGGVPMTLVLATDEPRPLLGLGRKFAVTGEGKWLCVGGRREFEQHEDPVLRELLDDAD